MSLLEEKSWLSKGKKPKTLQNADILTRKIIYGKDDSNIKGEIIVKKTPTLLMKELNFLESEANRLHLEDSERSYAPLNENMEFKYDTGYSYENNRKEIERIYKEELKIRSALAKFNSTTKASGLELTIAEALVRICQLKSEIKVLSGLANKTEYTETSIGGYRSNQTVTNKINYDQNKVIEDLKNLQKELSAIQIAVDKTNLTTPIEY